ncbi:MAG: putative peptidoglycan glycosyltransferase FtsW [Anaerolineae bacterium]|jgi:cell division protein FtsW
MAKSKTETLGQPDWILLLAVAGLIAVGLMMVYSSTFDMGYRGFDDTAYFFKRQVRWLVIGTVAMYIASRMHYRHWMKLSIPIMALALLLLITLVVSGKGRLLLEKSVSPVELAKLAVIVYIGHWLASKGEQLRRLPYGLLPFTIIVGVVAGLVMAQPDISEAIVIVLVSVAMFFLAGADLSQFAIGIVGGTTAFTIVIKNIGTAMERLQPFFTYWKDPLASSNDQLRQGLIALGSGGLFGLGPGSGRMKYRWLPTPHTDSVFAIVGEELGLVGCLTLIGLFALLAYRGFRTAGRASDAFGRLLALGITCWITFQAWINMAVVTGTIPYTGITLPFISVGGSSLVTCMVGIGILLNISRAASSPSSTSEARDASQRQDRASKTETGTGT